MKRHHNFMGAVMVSKCVPLIDNVALAQGFCHYQCILYYLGRRVFETWELVEFGNGLLFWSLF